MISILYPINELKIGGAEQQLLELVRGIDKTRFHPIIAPLYPGGSLDGEFRSIPGVDVVEINRRGKFDPLPLWRISSLLRRYRVDIVQPFLTPSTFFGLVPALVVGTPVTIVTERCGVRRSRGVGNKIYRKVEDRLSHFADAIVPNSLAGQEMLLDRGLPVHKVRVIYNGVNLERLNADPSRVAAIRQQLSSPAGGMVVGIIASLTPPKGHDLLLRSLAVVRQSHPGIRLAVVGDGPSRESLEILTEELGLSDHVVFFGYQRNIADYLAAFDLLVSASRDNEGCSNSILEAMAVGVPVIAMDVGGNRELIQHDKTGFLVPAGNHQRLAETISDTLTYRQKTEAIAQHARMMIDECFSLQRMIRDYEDLYSRLHAEACHRERRSMQAPNTMSAERLDVTPRNAEIVTHRGD